MKDDLKETFFKIANNIKVANNENDERFIKEAIREILERIVKNNAIDWEIFYKEEKRIRRNWEKRVEIFSHVLKVFKVAGVLSRLEDTAFVLVKEGEILKGFYLYGKELFPVNEDDAKKLAEAYKKLTGQKIELFQIKRVQR